MGDEFTGIPSDAWWELRDRQAGQGWLLLAVLSLVLLVTLTLVTKGVLTWGDLFPLARRG